MIRNSTGTNGTLAIKKYGLPVGSDHVSRGRGPHLRKIKCNGQQSVDANKQVAEMNKQIAEINKTGEPQTESLQTGKKGLTAEEREIAGALNSLLKAYKHCNKSKASGLLRKYRERLVTQLAKNDDLANRMAQKIQVFSIYRCETVPGQARVFIEMLAKAGRNDILYEIYKKAPENISKIADEYL